MTWELVALTIALTGGGYLYFHLTGKAFDRRYRRSPTDITPGDSA